LSKVDSVIGEGPTELSGSRVWVGVSALGTEVDGTGGEEGGVVKEFITSERTSLKREKTPSETAATSRRPVSKGRPRKS